MHANVMAGSLLYMYVAPPLVSVKYNHAENNPGLHVQSNFTDLLYTPVTYRFTSVYTNNSSKPYFSKDNGHMC